MLMECAAVPMAHSSGVHGVCGSACGARSKCVGAQAVESAPAAPAVAASVRRKPSDWPQVRARGCSPSAGSQCHLQAEEKGH